MVALWRVVALAQGLARLTPGPALILECERICCTIFFIVKKGRSQGYLIRLVKLARGDIFETGKGSTWYSNVLNRIQDEHVVSVYYIRTLEVSQTHLKPLLYINYLVKLLNQFSCISLSPCSLRLIVDTTSSLS